MVKQIKIVLQNFPRKHLLAIALGVALLTTLSMLSNINLQERKVTKDLSSTINVENLLEPDTFQKYSLRNTISVTAKKNDSLYTILKKIKVEEQNILKLINSKNSKLLSKIQVGNRFEISLDEMNAITNLKFVKDYKSGVQVTLNNNTYSIETMNCH